MEQECVLQMPAHSDIVMAKSAKHSGVIIISDRLKEMGLSQSGKKEQTV